MQLHGQEVGASIGSTSATNVRIWSVHRRWKSVKWTREVYWSGDGHSGCED